MPQQKPPAVGEDVTALMGGGVGEDVSALLAAPKDRSVAPPPPEQRSTGGKLINLFKLFAPSIVDPAGLAPDKLKSTAADAAVGGMKSIGRTAQDWVNLYGAGLPTIEDLQPSNVTERLGGMATDAATAIVPAAAAGRATAAGMRGVAVPMWQNAAKRPMTEAGTEMAEDVLRQGVGRLTRSNAQTYLNSPTSIAAKAPTMKSRAAAFKSIDSSYQQGQKGADSVMKAVTTGTPHLRSAAAQGLYSAAPAVDAGVAGGGPIFYALLRSLLGGDDK